MYILLEPCAICRLQTVRPTTGDQLQTTLVLLSLAVVCCHEPQFLLRCEHAVIDNLHSVLQLYHGPIQLRRIMDSWYPLTKRSTSRAVATLLFRKDSTACGLFSRCGVVTTKPPPEPVAPLGASAVDAAGCPEKGSPPSGVDACDDMSGDGAARFLRLCSSKKSFVFAATTGLCSTELLNCFMLAPAGSSMAKCRRCRSETRAV